MGIEEGDLVMPLMATDRRVVGYKVVSPEEADDLVAPLMAADRAVGVQVRSMDTEGDFGFGGMAADDVAVALKTMEEDLWPLIEKHCSGPGDGLIGEWKWVDGDDHTKGIEIWYMSVWEHYVGFAAYGEDTVIGPIICPFGEWYRTDATWYVTWEKREHP